MSMIKLVGIIFKAKSFVSQKKKVSESPYFFHGPVGS